MRRGREGRRLSAVLTSSCANAPLRDSLRSVQQALTPDAVLERPWTMESKIGVSPLQFLESVLFYFRVRHRIRVIN